MIKHGVLVPFAFLIFALIFGFYNHEAIGKEYGTKTNIFHDAIGAKILSDNDVAFQKIVITKGKDVYFCDDKQTLFHFENKTKSTHLKKKNSVKCGKVLTQDGVKTDNGAGKLFSSIFKAMKTKEPQNNDAENEQENN